MRLPKLLALLAGFVLSASAYAADRWYQITITDGGSSVEFTGTSAFTPEQIGDMVVGTKLLILDNLRENVNLGTDEQPQWGWDKAASPKAYIVPKHILFFFELTGDPMAEPAAPPPAEAAPAAPEKPAPATEKSGTSKGKKK